MWTLTEYCYDEWFEFYLVESQWRRLLTQYRSCHRSWYRRVFHRNPNTTFRFHHKHHKYRQWPFRWSLPNNLEFLNSQHQTILQDIGIENTHIVLRSDKMEYTVPCYHTLHCYMKYHYIDQHLHNYQLIKQKQNETKQFAFNHQTLNFLNKTLILFGLFWLFETRQKRDWNEMYCCFDNTTRSQGSLYMHHILD
jgi:hypothetical protein